MKRFLLLLILFLLAARYPMEARGATERESGQGVGAGDLGTNSLPSAIVPLTVGGFDADSISRHFGFSGNSLKTLEQNPLTGAWRLVGGGAVISDTCAQFMADSSVVYYVGDLKNLTLWVLVQGGGRTTRTAISAREHLSGVSDTVSVFRTITRASAGTLGQAAWGADSLGFGGTVQPLNQAPGSGEFMLHTSESALATARWADQSGGRAWSIPLHVLWGADKWTPYISVRVRNLMSDAAARYIVYITGTPL